jgi:hypothetical protein
MLEMSICKGKGINIELQNEIKLEENHWRLIKSHIIIRILTHFRTHSFFIVDF